MEKRRNSQHIAIQPVRRLCNQEDFDPFNVSMTCRNMYLRSARLETSSIHSYRAGLEQTMDYPSPRTPIRILGQSTDLAAEPKISSMDTLLDRLKKLSIQVSAATTPTVSTFSKLRAQWRGEPVRPRKYLKGDEESYDDLYEKTKIPLPKTSVQPLSEEENRLVNRLLKQGQRGIISEYKTAIVEHKDIYRLAPDTWLNDEVINFYMVLLQERSQKDENLPSIHCFNTFFSSTLREHGYIKVKRWTKRVDIFAKDMVIIPINRAYHWTLGVINMKKKLVEVYDSLGGSHSDSVKLFFNYIENEYLDKKHSNLDMNEWKANVPTDIPKQGNMSDCGVFTCTFAERLTRRRIFDFSQHDMTMIRRRMVLDIVRKHLSC